jgi:hypothetical protein
MLKPFLVRRGSTWHLRLRLRGFEFWKSLKTSSRRIAVLRSKIAALTLYQVAMMNDEDLLLKANLKLAESMDALADLPVTVPMRKAGDDPAESSVDLLIKNEAAKRAASLRPILRPNLRPILPSPSPLSPWTAPVPLRRSQGPLRRFKARLVGRRRPL